ncbi:PEP-CTERM sorting domain-containing protein [Cerasicoccus fimbriatus]|uniref:PEP-CTERM sorting domain-containing protein n=1 Tax=Cerasicoccus fimbriatus TaxID=3014554 RepID=UPI0022B2FAF2|nr:PEP-CTERM sorting domain-containing protein [Cerasicoccus sp. TK19100]
MSCTLGLRASLSITTSTQGGNYSAELQLSEITLEEHASQMVVEGSTTTWTSESVISGTGEFGTPYGFLDSRFTRSATASNDNQYILDTFEHEAHGTSQAQYSYSFSRQVNIQGNDNLLIKSLYFYLNGNGIQVESFRIVDNQNERLLYELVGYDDRSPHETVSYPEYDVTFILTDFNYTLFGLTNVIGEYDLTVSWEVGFDYDTSEYWTHASNAELIHQFEATTVVPEPSTYSLLAAMAALAYAFKRRREVFHRTRI